ncbi:nucleotidyltransferase family protein [uncultured Methanomethylovorans sp.]|jgi:predicted nucleotidyltransferase|uniref:nucleotidyltransferase family protein n=1 Tax=uncultured Methanomethylovorans sp. TaxID=183759 RepID=UPI00261C8B2B|nr:nucleotidyltransferase family protein [uncultured Methanomethylovorans sp.]
MDALGTLREHESVLVERFGVKKVGVFGSFAKGEERRDSDVDILVEFKEGQKTFGNYMELKFYLEELFGRKVDLVIETAIKPRLREQILKEAVYA